MIYNKYMNKLNSIQKKLLKKMEELSLLLECSKIKYSIEGGTLIGALRHQGFIPWDDDVDIMIPESEIEKFKKIIHNTKGMTLTNYKNKTCHSFFKVYFEDTFVMNGKQKSFLKIDVFILYKERKFSPWGNLMRVMTVGYIDFKSYPPTRYLSKIFPFTKKWLQKRFIKIIKKSKIINENIGYIYDDVNYWNANKNTKYIYWKTEKIKFENITVNVSLDAANMMKNNYGDIMIEPDEKNREVHGTKLFDK